VAHTIAVGSDVAPSSNGTSREVACSLIRRAVELRHRRIDTIG
jgi:hypothetical protein